MTPLLKGTQFLCNETQRLKQKIDRTSEPDLPAGLGESLGGKGSRMEVAAADPRDTAISSRPFSHMDTGWAGTVVGSSLAHQCQDHSPHPTAVRSQCCNTSRPHNLLGRITVDRLYKEVGKGVQTSRLKTTILQPVDPAYPQLATPCTGTSWPWPCPLACQNKQDTPYPAVSGTPPHPHCTSSGISGPLQPDSRI